MKWEKLLASGRFGETPKSLNLDASRTEFEIDYDRIIFFGTFQESSGQDAGFSASGTGLRTHPIDA